MAGFIDLNGRGKGLVLESQNMMIMRSENNGFQYGWRTKLCGCDTLFMLALRRYGGLQTLRKAQIESLPKFRGYGPSHAGLFCCSRERFVVGRLGVLSR